MIEALWCDAGSKGTAVNSTTNKMWSTGTGEGVTESMKWFWRHVRPGCCWCHLDLGRITSLVWGLPCSPRSTRSVVSPHSSPPRRWNLPRPTRWWIHRECYGTTVIVTVAPHSYPRPTSIHMRRMWCDTKGRKWCTTHLQHVEVRVKLQMPWVKDWQLETKGENAEK